MFFHSFFFVCFSDSGSVQLFTSSINTTTSDLNGLNPMAFVGPPAATAVSVGAATASHPDAWSPPIAMMRCRYCLQPPIG